MKARVYVSNVFTTRHAKEKKNKELDRTLTKPSSLYPIQENKEKGKTILFNIVFQAQSKYIA